MTCALATLPEESSRSGPAILVVEDNPAIRESLSDLLELSGFAVTEAANGQEALEALSRGKFSVVLLDLMMPVMGGREFLRELRRRGEALPVIVITAEVGGVEAEVLALGSQACFPKPFDPEALFAALALLTR